MSKVLGGKDDEYRQRIHCRWLIGSLAGGYSINDGITVMSFFVSLIGAVLLPGNLSLF